MVLIMFCDKCGAVLPEGSLFCTSCGAQVTVAPAQPVQPQQPTCVYPAATPAIPGKGLAIASMVLGIVSFFCFPVITGILAVVFGAISKSKGCRSGMATAGIVCGIIGVALWLLMLIIFGSVGAYAELFNL